jgi:endoglucanase
VKFLVPEGAAVLQFMPALFQVESGTFDLKDLVLRPTDAAEVRAAEEAKAAAKAQRDAANAAARQAKASAAFAAAGDLIPNGNFEAPASPGSLGEGWGKAKSGLSLGEEEGNHFLRIESTEPGKTNLVYRRVDLPSGTEALELSFKWRVTDVKAGKEPWHDARIMIEFLDAAGKKVGPKPGPPYKRGSTDGWVEVKKSFIVPESAVALELMPALFEVKQGKLEIDDLSLKPTSKKAIEEAEAAYAKANPKPPPVPAEEPKPQNWPPELKVKGNRVVDPKGNEVWLQGVHVVSLEWNPRGENVERAIVVAIEEWKANVIRLSIKDEYWTHEKNGKEFQDLVERCVNLTANRGAYIVIDNHRYRAVRPEHLPFWKEVATKYKNHPAVLFDIINEPHGISWEVWRDGGFVSERQTKADEDAFLEGEDLKKSKQGFESPGMQALVDAIRSTGAKNIIIAGGLDWSYDLSGIIKGFELKDKSGNGIMYAAHIYPWKKGWQSKVLDIAEKHPIFVGEVGADANKMSWMPAEIQEDAETWVPDMLGLIQKHRLHWTAFSFHPKASPRMLVDWTFTPTPFWGEPVKRALAGEKFEVKRLR